MIKKVILDLNKQIWLILKIQKFKNPYLHISSLLFIKTEIRQVYDPFYNQILQLLYTIMFLVGRILKKLSTAEELGGMGEHS